MTWLRTEVESRLEHRRQAAVIGTRIAPVDLYSELMKPENYANGQGPVDLPRLPGDPGGGPRPRGPRHAVALRDQPGSKPGRRGRTTCSCGTRSASRASIDGEQLYPRWDGLHLEMRPPASPTTPSGRWSTSSRSVAGGRHLPRARGRELPPTAPAPGPAEGRHGRAPPRAGMHGMYVIAGLRPLHQGLRRHRRLRGRPRDQKRYVLNAWNMKAPTKAQQLEEKMKDVTEEYGVHEWRVEKTGLLQFFTQDAELRMWFSTRGVRFTEHNTGKNKWDAGLRRLLDGLAVR
jgi:hypothetical protein